MIAVDASLEAALAWQSRLSGWPSNIGGRCKSVRQTRYRTPEMDIVLEKFKNCAQRVT